MKPTPVAVIDACVLYSAALRDLIMWLNIRLVFQPKWTDKIHSEWIENLLRNRPDLTREKIERTRDLMNLWGRDWQTPEHEEIISSLVLPDPGDRHVLAAAIASNSFLIVTFNVSDFPKSALEEHAVIAVHPDAFFCELLDQDQSLFISAVKDQLDSLRNPPHTLNDLLAKFRKERIPNLADKLEKLHEEL